MRQLSPAVTNAITLGSGYLVYPKIRIEPTWVFIDTLSGSDAPGFADGQGILDNPVFQELGFSPISNLLVTFYVQGGELKYQLETGGAGIYPGSLSAHLPAYLFAGGSVIDRQLAYLRGGLSISDQQSAYLFGHASLVDNQRSFMVGNGIDIYGNAGRMRVGTYARAIANTFHLNAGVLLKYKFAQNNNGAGLFVWLRTSNDWYNNSSPTRGIGIVIPSYSNIVSVMIRDGGPITSSVSYPDGFVDTNYHWLRFQVSGSQIKYKIWSDGFAEPSEWRIVSSFPQELQSGNLQVAFVRSSGTIPLTAYIDDLEIYGA